MVLLTRYYLERYSKTFTVFLMNILLSLLSFGKCFLISRKNILPAFALILGVKPDNLPFTFPLLGRVIANRFWCMLDAEAVVHKRSLK